MSLDFTAIVLSSQSILPLIIIALKIFRRIFLRSDKRSLTRKSIGAASLLHMARRGWGCRWDAKGTARGKKTRLRLQTIRCRWKWWNSLIKMKYTLARQVEREIWLLNPPLPPPRTRQTWSIGNRDWIGRFGAKLQRNLCLKYGETGTQPLIVQRWKHASLLQTFKIPHLTSEF